MVKLHAIIAILAIVILTELHVAEANFYTDTEFTWGANNAILSGNGENLALKLTNASGSGIRTKNEYLFGSMEMHIKLVPGNSAGTVTAYYMSSTGDQHDEIDFEFLGNLSGQPYTIHTNVYANGVGSREQQFYPWFDPSSDYHNYTIHWNPSQIVWFIDSIPIRVFRNYENMGIAFPTRQPMRAYSSIWNADNWATRGGLVKIDWSCAPFVANYQQFSPRACVCDAYTVSRCTPYNPASWWANPVYSRLSFEQMGRMNWVRNNYMIYDYCKDTKRFKGEVPQECWLPQF